MILASFTQPPLRDPLGLLMFRGIFKFDPNRVGAPGAGGRGSIG